MQIIKRKHLAHLIQPGPSDEIELKILDKGEQVGNATVIGARMDDLAEQIKEIAQSVALDNQRKVDLQKRVRKLGEEFYIELDYIA